MIRHPSGALAQIALAACLALPALTWIGDGARAQMQLPGAMNGNTPSAGSGGSHGGGGGGGGASGAPPPPPKPIVIKAPTEDTIVGHPLSRDGTQGSMSFDKTGADLTLSKLSLAGDKISKPGQPCSVDVGLSPPLVAASAGRPVGALRFTVPLQACPFTIDVLDGAALVTRPEPTCDFKEADCRVSPEGLWGPAAADITPKRAKDLEHARVRFEETMRANFRALLKKAGKDRQKVKAIAREQAAFSSDREMTCRDYQQETVHGFCSTQITEARALALLAQFGNEPDLPRASRKSRPRPKPAAVQAAPAEAMPQQPAPQ